MAILNIAPLNVDEGTTTYLTPPVNPDDDDMIAVAKGGNLKYGIPGKTVLLGVGQAVADGHRLYNTTAAAVGGTQQWSPGYIAQGRGSWADAVAGEGSVEVAWVAYAQETGAGAGTVPTGGWMALQKVGGSSPYSGVWFQVAYLGLAPGSGNCLLFGPLFPAKVGLLGATANGNAQSLTVQGQEVKDEGNGSSVAIKATDAKSTSVAAKDGGSVPIQLGNKVGGGTAGKFTISGAGVVAEVDYDGTATFATLAHATNDGFVTCNNGGTLAHVDKIEVLGSKGSGAALAALLTALASMGLIIDSTSA